MRGWPALRVLRRRRVASMLRARVGPWLPEEAAESVDEAF